MLAEKERRDVAEEQQTKDSLFNLLEKLRRQDLATVKELFGSGMRRTKNSLGDREPSVLLENRLETKERYGQVVN